MASVIEVTEDVVYVLAGEKVTIPADSIVQSPSELVEAPGFKGGGEIYASLFTGTTQAGGRMARHGRLRFHNSNRRRSRVGGVPWRYRDYPKSGG